MDGLEAAEEKKSIVYDNNRLDNDYYQNKYIHAVKHIKNKYLLQEMAAKITCGPFGSNLRDDTYQKSGVPVIRPFNIKNFTVESDNHVYISEQDVVSKKFARFGKTALFFARVGSAACGINPFSNVVISPNIIAAKIKNETVAKFMAVFFNSKYGKLQIERNLKVVAQPTITTEIVGQLAVPSFSDDFVKIIASIMSKSMISADNAKFAMLNAQNTFLKELHLDKWNPDSDHTSVQKYSRTKKTNRWDAEYHQPQYNSLIKKLKSYPHGHAMVGQSRLAKLQDGKYIPDDRREYKYIELSNIGNYGNINGCTHAAGQDLPDRARQQVCKNNIIVSSVEGSLSSVALITGDYHLSLCSTGFHIIGASGLNAETLLVLFKSVVGQLQLKQGCSGTILTAINADHFKNIVLPNIPKTLQNKIKKKVDEAQNNRSHARFLLAMAKSAVEIAVEKGEKAARRELEKNNGKL